MFYFELVVCVGLLLVEILFDELFRSFQSLGVLLPFRLHQDLVPESVLNCSLIFVAFAHDVRKDVLFAEWRMTCSGVLTMFYI